MSHPHPPRARILRFHPGLRWTIPAAALFLGGFYAFGRLARPAVGLPDCGELTVGAVMVAGLAGLTLHAYLYQGPDLELLLTSPLTQAQIFLRKWRSLAVVVSGLGGLAALVALTYWLGAGYGVTELATTAVALAAAIVFTVALVALAGPLPQVLNLGLIFSFAIWMESRNHLPAWLTGGRGPLIWAAGMTVTAAVLGLLAAVSLRFTYRRETLERRLERRPAPDTVVGPIRRSPRLAAGVRRRLSPRARALWQLATLDDAPECLASRVPSLLLLFAVAWMLGAGLELWPWADAFGEEDPTVLRPAVYGFWFFCAGALGVLVVSSPGRALRSHFVSSPPHTWHSELEVEPWPEPFHEVWPVDVRDYLKVSLAAYGGASSLLFLCLLPFALLVPVPKRLVLHIVGLAWLGSLLLVGFAVQARLFISTDPRRGPPRTPLPIRVAVGLLACLAAGEAVHRIATGDWTPVSAALLRALSWLSAPFVRLWELTPVGFLALLLALQWTYLPALLRRHRRRWFDSVF